MPDLSQIHRILILQYQPFGDVLLNTAYLPFLKQRFPGVSIDYLVRTPFDIVLEGNPHIDNLLRFRKCTGIAYLRERLRVIGLIRRGHYDLVIDQLKGGGSAMLTVLSGARYRLGYRESRYAWVYNIKGTKGPLRYYAAMKFDLLKPLGILEESCQTVFAVSSESIAYADSWIEQQGLAGMRFVVFSPGSPIAAKRWEPRLFARVADRIVEKSRCSVVVLWAPRELGTAREMIAHAKGPLVLGPESSFNQAAAFLQRSALLVCNDGGLNHVAIAVGTPSVAVFSITNPLKWSGHELGNHFYFRTSDNRDAPGMEQGLNPNVVADKVLEILEAALL